MATVNQCSEGAVVLWTPCVSYVITPSPPPLPPPTLLYKNEIESINGQWKSERRMSNCVISTVPAGGWGITTIETSKLLIAIPLWGEATDDRWIPIRMAHWCGKLSMPGRNYNEEFYTVLTVLCVTKVIAWRRNLWLCPWPYLCTF